MEGKDTSQDDFERAEFFGVISYTFKQRALASYLRGLCTISNNRRRQHIHTYFLMILCGRSLSECHWCPQLIGRERDLGEHWCHSWGSGGLTGGSNFVVGITDGKFRCPGSRCKGTLVHIHRALKHNPWTRPAPLAW